MEGWARKIKTKEIGGDIHGRRGRKRKLGEGEGEVKKKSDLGGTKAKRRVLGAEVGGGGGGGWGVGG